MVNANKLRAIIIERGMTQQVVAKELGMAPKTFYSKVKKGVFGSDEINKMIDLLKIKDPMNVFFGRQVTLKVTKKALLDLEDGKVKFQSPKGGSNFKERSGKESRHDKRVSVPVMGSNSKVIAIETQILEYMFQSP